MGGGGSHHETHYTFIDQTARILEENRRREQERLEAERRERERQEQEIIARVKQEAAESERLRLLEVQRKAQLAEQERIRKEQERLERERQKQRELQAQSTSKRQALCRYKLGDKTSIGNFKGVEISDVTKLRIGVFGPTGSGKSCFINTCERTVRQTDKGSVPVATTGAEGTIILEDYLAEMFFRLVDTRGFFNYDHHEGRELNDILFGRIKSGDFIQRTKSEPRAMKSTSDAPFDCWLHSVILVVKANDIRLRNETLKNYLLPVRQTLGPLGIAPVTVVTHRDTLKSDRECEDALDLASAATGSSRSHTFFVANYCPDHPGPDVNTELQVFEILHFALLNAEEYVKSAKRNRLVKIKEELRRAIESTSTTAAVAVRQAALDVFLEVMQSKYNWSLHSVEKVTRDLHQEDVKTLDTLASCWTDIKSFFPSEMRTIVEQDLSKMRMI